MRSELQGQVDSFPFIATSFMCRQKSGSRSTKLVNIALRKDHTAELSHESGCNPGNVLVKLLAPGPRSLSRHAAGSNQQRKQHICKTCALGTQNSSHSQRRNADVLFPRAVACHGADWRDDAVLMLCLIDSWYLHKYFGAPCRYTSDNCQHNFGLQKKCNRQFRRHMHLV